MKIWILQTGEPMHCDNGVPRPMRAMNLAETMAERGHSVTVWTSSFYHQEKRHRSQKFAEIRVSDRISNYLVPSPGYQRNVGVGRLFDHAVLGMNLSRLLNSGSFEPPDVAFIGFPPIETAFVMERWLRKRGVGVMLDAKDEWPDIFLQPIPGPFKLMGRILLAPYFLLAESTFRNAHSYCSMSDAFVDWMCLRGGRPRRESDHVAPLTSQRYAITESQRDDAVKWWSAQGVDLSKLNRVCFVGSFTSAFDFGIVRNLACRSLKDEKSCEFVICGDGDQSETVMKLLGDLPNVRLPGWVNRPRAEVLYEASVAMIAPYSSSYPFTRVVPNKIVDALRTGLLILTTLGGTTEELVREHSVGISSTELDELYLRLVQAVTDSNHRAKVQEAGHSAYEKLFRHDHVYGGLAEKLELLAGA